MTEFTADTISAALVNITWRSTLTIALAQIAMRAIPKLSAERRREIGVLSLALVVAITIATLGSAALEMREGPPTTTLSRLIGERGELQILTETIPTDAARWLQLALLFWLAGTLFAVGRTLQRFVNSARLVASATTVSDVALRAMVAQLAAQKKLSAIPSIRQSASITTAAVCGVFNKTILLSTSHTIWSPERREQVLLHELCHIANNDLTASLIAQSARALLWWNPFVHVAVRDLSLQQEYVCDEQVVHAGTPADEYAETLLDLARSPSYHAHDTVLAVAASAIRERVERLLRSEQTPSPEWHRWYSRTAIAAITALAMIPGVGLRNNSIRERVIDMRDATGSQPGTVRIDRDASGNIRVQPAPPPAR